MNKAKAEYLNISQLRPFAGHPFQVKEDEEMEQLVWSILTQGLLTPLVVRPIENNQYEVISGHRRLHACKKAGIETVPALIYPRYKLFKLYEVTGQTSKTKKIGEEILNMEIKIVNSLVLKIKNEVRVKISQISESVRWAFVPHPSSQ